MTNSAGVMRRKLERFRQEDLENCRYGAAGRVEHCRYGAVGRLEF